MSPKAKQGKRAAKPTRGRPRSTPKGSASYRVRLGPEHERILRDRIGWEGGRDIGGALRRAIVIAGEAVEVKEKKRIRR